MAARFELRYLPPAPSGKCPEVRRARKYLEATHDSVSRLLDSFSIVREEKIAARKARQGRLGRDELDLLRAALVFTSSGLDAACHALVENCVPSLVDRTGSTAARKFEAYLDEQAANPTKDFRAAVKSRNPRNEFVRLYIEAKTKASYQGTKDLRDRVRDLLGISDKTVPDARIDDLRGFFVARNDIVHKLDYVTPQGKSTARHSRSPENVVRECDLVLTLVADLISGAADVIRGK